LGDLRAAIFEEPIKFGSVLRFEARIFAGGFVEIGDVLACEVTEFGIFEANVPLMVFFFHLVALVFDAEFLIFAGLRFEAIFGLAPFGS
jgi:hypothetical protein